MCHYCGAKFAKSSNFTEQENGHSMELDRQPSIESCKFCGEKDDINTTNQENSSSCSMSEISPTVSLRSSGSSVLSCTTLAPILLFYLPLFALCSFTHRFIFQVICQLMQTLMTGIQLLSFL